MLQRTTCSWRRLDSIHSLGHIADPALRSLKSTRLYRALRQADVCGSRIILGATKRQLVNLGSNDYLGLGSIQVSKQNTRQFQSSSRLIAGNDPSFTRLEKLLARHKSQHGSLVYPTGYMANIGALTAVATKNDLILSDALNHASIIDACRLSGATIKTYKHNDVDDLCKRLKRHQARHSTTNMFVVTEGVFSMDGDMAPLAEIVEVSNKAGAITVVDDAHGDFVVGSDGRGTPHSMGVAKQIGMYTSSLSKALGAFGGYVAAQDNVIDLCINRSRPLIYTSALPSMLVDDAIKKFGSDREARRKRLCRNVYSVARGLEGIGFDTMSSTTQIIPIMIGDEKTALQMGEYLISNGVFAVPIRFPTVPAGLARLRVSVTAWLSADDIDIALGAFEKAYQKFRSRLPSASNQSRPSTVSR